MLPKLIFFISLVLVVTSCTTKTKSSELINTALDNQFSISSKLCFFNTSELLFDTSKSVIENSCTQRARHRLHSIIGEQINKRIYLQRGHSFIDSLNLIGLNKYLGDGFYKIKELGNSYLYPNRNMFEGMEVIDKEELFRDWDIRHACLIEITDTYYSADKKKAALGLLNYCGHSEVYLIYYFINIKGTWLINFVEVGD